jgi:hypothetical protein
MMSGMSQKDHYTFEHQDGEDKAPTTCEHFKSYKPKRWSILLSIYIQIVIKINSQVKDSFNF